MKSNAKDSSKKKSIKNSAPNTKILDRNDHPVEIEIVNPRVNKRGN